MTKLEAIKQKLEPPHHREDWNDEEVCWLISEVERLRRELEEVQADFRGAQDTIGTRDMQIEELRQELAEWKDRAALEAKRHLEHGEKWQRDTQQLARLREAAEALEVQTALAECTLCEPAWSSVHQKLQQALKETE